MTRVLSISTAILLALGTPARAQNFAPPAPVQPTEAQLDALKERLRRLEREVSSLQRRQLPDPVLADIEVYLKAAQWMVKHGEFYRKEYYDWTLNAIDRGLFRAGKASSNDANWYDEFGSTIARGYRSFIDGSVQPFAVTLPANYGKGNQKYRLDIVLHGRNATLTEVSFLQAHNGDKPPPRDLDRVIIDIYGRGNNAYRWAGEMDVQEAVQFFLNAEKLKGRDIRIDNSRVVLRGFSMGGAGTWHLGLHKPDRFCVIGPGAGFTTTRGYTKLPDQLPDYIEKCLRIYDAVDYAENAFNVPVVAYSGEEDKQKTAADNIAQRLKGTPYQIQHLVAPGVGHTIPPEWAKQLETEYAKHVARGRAEYPERVRFVTYTMRYHICDWVEILGLEQHYEKAVVDAKWDDNKKEFTVNTQNVRALHLGIKPTDPTEKFTVTIDGTVLKDVVPYRVGNAEPHIYLMKGKSGWEAVWLLRVIVDQARRPQKRHGLHGPIDDAFTAPFLCVRPTGTPWNKAVNDRALASLERFQKEWSKWLRGELPVKDDVEVTPADVLSKHLILFGDPGSNSFIAQSLDALPLTWTKDTVKLGGIEAKAAQHLPVLIYPSPLNTERYVVLNSGHTFHEEDFKGTNALLYPRLGDYAVLDLDEKVVGAGLFDDFWRVKK